MGNQASASQNKLTKTELSLSKSRRSPIKFHYNSFVDMDDPRNWLPTNFTPSKVALNLEVEAPPPTCVSEPKNGQIVIPIEGDSTAKLSLPMTPFSFKRSRGQHPGDGLLSLIPSNSNPVSNSSSNQGSRKRRPPTTLEQGDPYIVVNNPSNTEKPIPLWYPQENKAPMTNLMKKRVKSSSLGHLKNSSNDSFLRRLFRFRKPASDIQVVRRRSSSHINKHLPVDKTSSPPPETGTHLAENATTLAIELPKSNKPAANPPSSYSSSYAYSSSGSTGQPLTPATKSAPSQISKNTAPTTASRVTSKKAPTSSSPSTPGYSKATTTPATSGNTKESPVTTTLSGKTVSSQDAYEDGSSSPASGSPAYGQRTRGYAGYSGGCKNVGRGPLTRKIPPPPVYISNYGCSSGTKKGKLTPADRLQNVDIVEELCYSCPEECGCGPCNPNCDYYSCCNDCGGCTMVPCCPPSSCGGNPVKYCRRQRFNFDDGKPKEDPCDGPPFRWPCRPTNPYDEIPVGKNPTPQVVSCAVKASVGCDGDCNQVLPSESGTYFFDADRKCFVPVIEVKNPETPKREIVDEIIEDEPVLTNIEPIIQPVVQPPDGGCGLGPIGAGIQPFCGSLQGNFISPSGLPGCSSGGNAGSRGKGNGASNVGCEDIGMKALGGMNMNGLANMGPYGTIAVPQFNYAPPPPLPVAPNGPCPPVCPQGPCAPAPPCQPVCQGPICFPGYPFPMCPPRGQKGKKSKGGSSATNGYGYSGKSGDAYGYGYSKTGTKTGQSYGSGTQSRSNPTTNSYNYMPRSSYNERSSGYSEG